MLLLRETTCEEHALISLSWLIDIILSVILANLILDKGHKICYNKSGNHFYGKYY